MARRRRASTGKEEWARPIIGLVLLGLLYLGFQIGLLNAASEWMMSLLKPR